MLKNAKSLPQRYFGLHMVEGVAEYKDPTVNNGEPYRIFIGEETIKNMDPSFECRPVYVQHVDDVNLENLQEEADGYVVKSFYNQADGKHWCEFIVVSDKGHEAIKRGWKLSNAYLLKDTAPSGGRLWHGVEYLKEVTQGEYEHLAIVPNPRYEESVIMTPERFKAYNAEKELALLKLANSKETESMLSFFKKAKAENSADLESLSVMLPKSKKEFTIVQLVNAMDEIQNMAGYASPDHMVKVGNEEMSVNDLVAKHMEMQEKMNAASAEEAAEGEDEAKKKENAEDDEKKKKEAAEKEADAKAKNAADEKADKAKAKKENFDGLMNARAEAAKIKPVDTAIDALARGQARYGSKK